MNPWLSRQPANQPGASHAGESELQFGIVPVSQRVSQWPFAAAFPHCFFQILVSSMASGAAQTPIAQFSQPFSIGFYFPHPSARFLRSAI
ncbi:hypothetical protein [Limnothrix redekei]|uniref:Uncharacterized protein n=1 Tax=Limnothrix redekei LRLZ20PSL1 TaxID=3112953 RepID=A0ABW7CCU4_9CYAN